MMQITPVTMNIQDETVTFKFKTKENSVTHNTPASYQYYCKTCLVLRKIYQLNFTSNPKIWQSHTYQKFPSQTYTVF